MRIDHGSLVTFSHLEQSVSFFVLNPLDEIQRHHYAGQFYEPEELSIISKYCNRTSIFLDIGANVGNHTVFASKILGVPTVIPFEVSPEAIHLLKINILLNGCTNVMSDFLGIGVANRDCALQSVFELNNNLGSRRYALASPAKQAKQFQAVKADRLVAHMPVGFIKIDIEGMELEALLGLDKTITTFHPGIFVEIEDKCFSDVEGFLLERGYHIADRFTRYQGKTNYMFV